MEKTAAITKKDESKRLIYCVVLEPDSFDLQNDSITTDEIERAAHQYAMESRIVGLQHEEVAKAYVVESFIAPVDFETVKKGSWVMAIKVPDDAIWQAIINDELTGLSIGGVGEREAISG